MSPPGAARFVALFFWELTLNLPALFALRPLYRKRARTAGSEPIVVCVSDNLDEVNGIALASRVQVAKLREMGKTAFLFGVAFHTRPPRVEGLQDSLILAPGRYSLDQAGYAESELAVLRLDHFIRFLRDHTIDLVELQTPGPVAVLCLIAAKFAGIKTLSHYRTDILAYSHLLVRNRPGVWSINTWTKMVTRLAGPVIVPSLAFRDKVEAMGVPSERIFKLPRGVDLDMYHPDKVDNGAWGEQGLPANGIKLLYVGRVSLEKNLPLLVDVFTALLRRRADFSLTIVGDGPYRKAMEEKMAGIAEGKIRFTGVLHGEQLAGIFAAADIFVFPSLTDTFGNSVIEALASGVPCITSDQGGPKEIIVDGECGLIFDSSRAGDFEEKILALATDPARLKGFKSKARERALQFTNEAAASAFWNFYCRYVQNKT